MPLQVQGLTDNTSAQPNDWDVQKHHGQLGIYMHNGNGGTSSNAKSSSSQQLTLTSQWNNESSLQPCCRWGRHQPAISWWYMPVYTSAWFVAAVQFARVYMSCAGMHNLRCIHSLYMSHHVICDASHATLILLDSWARCRSHA